MIYIYAASASAVLLLCIFNVGVYVGKRIERARWVLAMQQEKPKTFGVGRHRLERLAAERNITLTRQAEARGRGKR